jgi:hypothetical protein
LLLTQELLYIYHLPRSYCTFVTYPGVTVHLLLTQELLYIYYLPRSYCTFIIYPNKVCATNLSSKLIFTRRVQKLPAFHVNRRSDVIVTGPSRFVHKITPCSWKAVSIFILFPYLRFRIYLQAFQSKYLLQCLLGRLL